MCQNLDMHRIFFYIILLTLGIFFPDCQRQSNKIYQKEVVMKQAIDLHLTIESEAIRIIILNKSEHDLLLWDRNNSWGWSMFSLLLARPGSDEWKELTVKPIRWTVNIPRALNLPVGGRLEYDLQLGNPKWNDLDSVEGWPNQPVQVRARLRIPETPEAVAQNVFIGEALSSSCLSSPPHSWLTGQGH